MKPLILITNDDGITSPGLKAAAEAVSDLGSILIVAPHIQQTGMGRSFPICEDNGIIEKTNLFINGEAIIGYGVHGSPAFAVAHAVLELAIQKPTLCISGVNYGENLGLSLSCSGTLGAAFEANSHGIKAIAFSMPTPISKQHDSDFVTIDWNPIKMFIHTMVKEILEQGLPNKASILNVNFPESIEENTPWRWTRQSSQNYSEFIKPERRSFDQGVHLESKRKIEITTTPINSDVYAIAFDRVISVTPLTWDFSLDKDKNDPHYKFNPNEND